MNNTEFLIIVFCGIFILGFIISIIVGISYANSIGNLKDDYEKKRKDDPNVGSYTDDDDYDDYKTKRNIALWVALGFASPFILLFIGMLLYLIFYIAPQMLFM